MGEWLLAGLTNSVVRGQALVVVVASLALGLSAIGSVVTWWVTKDLERNTVVGVAALIVVLGGLVWAARSGYVALAAWGIILIVIGAVTGSVYYYGISSNATGFFVVPILVASICLGDVGYIVALVCIGIVWMSAIAAEKGWRRLPNYERWHLTFEAPTATILFFITVLIVRAYVVYVEGKIQ